MYVVFICTFAINIVMKMFSVHMKSIVVLTNKYVSLDECILSFALLQNMNRTNENKGLFFPVFDRCIVTNPNRQITFSHVNMILRKSEFTRNVM